MILFLVLSTSYILPWSTTDHRSQVSRCEVSSHISTSIVKVMSDISRSRGEVTGFEIQINHSLYCTTCFLLVSGISFFLVSFLFVVDKGPVEGISSYLNNSGESISRPIKYEKRITTCELLPISESYSQTYVKRLKRIVFVLSTKV